MKIITYLLVIIGFLLPFNWVYAQSKPKIFGFKADLEASQMTYTVDRNFDEFEGIHKYSCASGEQNNALLYTVINKDSSIVIGFTLMPPLSKEMMSDPKIDYEHNYIKTARSMADTINHKLILYKPEYVKAKFNADDVGEYYRACPIPYNGKYPFRKIVFGAKKATGQFEVIYFYNNKAAKDVDKVIKATAGIIRFND